jgi:hypothetical protein
VAIDGNWNLTMQSPMGAREVQANFASDGGALSGTFTGAQGSAPLTGTVDGNAVNFGATIQGPMGEMALKFDGALDGDAVSGTVQFGSFGSGTFTGNRA